MKFRQDDCQQVYSIANEIGLTYSTALRILEERSKKQTSGTGEGSAQTDDDKGKGKANEDDDGWLLAESKKDKKKRRSDSGEEKAT